MKAGVETTFVEEDSGYFDHDGPLVFLVGEATIANYVREVSVEGIDAGDWVSTIDGGFGIVVSEFFQHALLNLVELGSNVDCMRW